VDNALKHRKSRGEKSHRRNSDQIQIRLTATERGSLTTTKAISIEEGLRSGT